MFGVSDGRVEMVGKKGISGIVTKPVMVCREGND